MSDMSGRLRRTQVCKLTILNGKRGYHCLGWNIGTFQVTNYTLKSAASVSNALGSVVVSYSIFHALLSLAGGTLSLLTINFHFPDFLFIGIQMIMLIVNFHFPDFLSIGIQMIMSGCPMKRSLAYPEHSQALCSNQPVAHWSAWKYVNHQSTWNIDFLLSLRVNSLTFYISGGSCGLGSCFPLGFRLEKTGICATLHLAWTPNLNLDFATLQLTRRLFLCRHLQI